MENKNKGFTIIELIVVIAIIAVLAAVITASVTKYIATSKDAAIKGNLRTIQTNAAVYYAEHNSYEHLDEEPNYIAAYNQIDSKNGSSSTVYNAFSTDAYCASSSLNVTDPNDNSGGYTDWCVDSTGFSGQGTCCDGYPNYWCTTPSGC